MSEDKLPDNIKRFDVLKVERSIEKLCQCYGTPHYTIDTRNRLVYCKDCGGIVDAFEALTKIADYKEGFVKQSEQMLEQRRQLINWKPWLLVFRKLEEQYRSGKMLPCCPSCGKPFYFERIIAWYNRKLFEKQVEREKSTEN